METLVTEDPVVAAALLRRGELVAFPTETVYGLGADARNNDAVAAVFAAKGRPADNPLIVHIAHLWQLESVAESVPQKAAALINHFFPGPLTLVVRRHASIPSVVTAGLDTIAVRMPSLPLARSFLTACHGPVAAPSANQSGRPSATTWEAVWDDLNGRIRAILRDGPTPQGIESTVVDCTQDVPVLLRAGAISAEALASVSTGLRLKLCRPGMVPRSPGQRHRHYAPNVRLALIATPHEAVPDSRHAYIGVSPVDESAEFGLCHVAPDLEGYARVLFAFFRQCEAAGMATIFCQKTTEDGLGRALMDRLQRAAAA